MPWRVAWRDAVARLSFCSRSARLDRRALCNVGIVVHHAAFPVVTYCLASGEERVDSVRVVYPQPREKPTRTTPIAASKIYSTQS
jgi:hypothetical protein